MTTRIGTLQTTVEVVPDSGVGAEAHDEQSQVTGERARVRAMLQRERAIALRTRAEGFDD